MAVAFLQELPGTTQEQYDQVRWRAVGGSSMCGSRRKQSTSSFKSWGRRCKKQGFQLRNRSSGLSTTCSVGRSITFILQAKGAGLSTPFSSSQVRA